jgi:hypothetical protein
MINSIRFGTWRQYWPVRFRHWSRAVLMFKICAFGQYKNSGWDGHQEHVNYEYRGKVYRLPSEHHI